MSSPRRAVVFAVSNQKGGEGKTTTAVNLAASLAASDRRTLLVDLDPQANASSAIGLHKGEVAQGTYEVLMGAASVRDVLRPTDLEQLWVLPTTSDLAGARVELVDVPARETVLSRALTTSGLRDEFDYILIDCPPSLDFLTVNALAAADAVLIPMQAKYFSLEGLGELTATIEALRDSVNPGLHIAGIVFCMFDGRTNLAKQVLEDVSAHFGELVFETRVPNNVRLSESPSFGKPALLYDIESRGAQAYLELAAELLARVEGDRTATETAP